MKYNFLLIFTLWSCYSYSQINPQFVTPIEGVYGKDYIIVNYADWGLNTLLDHKCGSKTYGKHEGTDMTLKSFPQMDQGVNVLAADTGIVTFIHDGEFDRQTISVPSRGLGNYIAIRHPNKMYSYYGHLKKNSIIVKPGDVVSPGQVIGQIGSSGNSTDPHLHFETWFDSLYLVDPFSGPCGNPTSLWIDSIPYDTLFNVWESGTVGYIPFIDSLRERVGPQTVFTEQDSIVSYWNLQYGIHKGDSSRIDWYTPQGDLWFSFTNHYIYDWWYYYYFSYIDRPSITLLGEWTYKFYHNDQLQITGNFILDNSVINKDLSSTKSLIKYALIERNLNITLSQEIIGESICISSLSGQQVLNQKFINPYNISLDLNGLTPCGVYLATIRYKTGVSTIKIVL